MALPVLDVVLVLLIGYGYWRLPDVADPSLVFGVRVPAGHHDDPAIGRAKRIYRSLLPPLALATCLTALWLGRAGSLYGALVPVVFVAVTYLDFYFAHRLVQATKQAAGWYEGQRQATVADTTERLGPRPHSAGLLALAAGVIAATAIIGIVHYPQLPAVFATHFGASGRATGWSPKTPWSAFAPVFMQLGLTALFALLAVGLTHARQEIDPAAPAGSAARHRAFQGSMVRVLMVMAILLDATLMLTSLRIWGMPLLRGPLSDALPVLIGVAYAIWASLRVGQGGSQVRQPPEPPTGYVHRDDDRCWLGGAIYVNRKDPAFLVQRRFGVGWTLNFGHPASWLLAVAFVALVALGPILRAMR